MWQGQDSHGDRAVGRRIPYQDRPVDSGMANRLYAGVEGGFARPVDRQRSSTDLQLGEGDSGLHHAQSSEHVEAVATKTHKRDRAVVASQIQSGCEPGRVPELRPEDRIGKRPDSRPKGELERFLLQAMRRLQKQPRDVHCFHRSTSGWKREENQATGNNGE